MPGEPRRSGTAIAMAQNPLEPRVQASWRHLRRLRSNDERRGTGVSPASQPGGRRLDDCLVLTAVLVALGDGAPPAGADADPAHNGTCQPAMEL